jgi:predicted ATP-grasp superfamily ATP-dependent carboligase
MTRVIIAGVSTRAAAESAARAGYAVTSFDAYGDLDQHPSVRVVSLPRDVGVPFTPRAAARAARSIDADAVAYLSSFENHPRAVEILATRRSLWGNPPEVLRRVRDPFALSDALRRRGFATPAILGTGPGPSPLRPRPVPTALPRPYAGPDPDWLLKPRRSGGGQGVRRWSADARIPRGHYLQEFIEGTPGSIVFVAAGGRAVPLGVSTQLVGDAAFGASGHRYCGNILHPCDGDLFTNVYALAQAVTEDFGLVGVNGIDFIARGRVPSAIEVNPRWSSSMELVERAYGLSVFAVHAAACANGELPSFDLSYARQTRAVHGKAIVFAREDSIAPDTRTWLTDPTVRDVPHPGEAVAKGQPICTVFATADDVGGCEAALASRAARVYAEIGVKTLEPGRATK